MEAVLTEPREMRLEIDYEPHPGQKLFHDSAARMRILACGARWGKDRATINEVIRIAADVVGDERRSLVPRVHCWFVTPSYPMSAQLWRELKYFTPRELLAKPPNETTRRIEWNGDVVMEVKSADDPESLVAVGLDVVAVTEAALIKQEAWEMALRPRLASPGRLGLAIFNGTPKGRNWYHRLYMTGQNGNPDTESWNFPTAAVIGDDGGLERHPYGNPYIRLSEIENARRSMPERWFRQEFLADWLGAEGAVFRFVRERVAAPPTNPKTPIVAGADIAKRHDFTVFAAFDGNGRMVAMDRMNILPYPQQAQRFATFVHQNHVGKAVIETNGPGEPFYDMLSTELHEAEIRCELVPYQTTATSKKQMIDALAVAFEQGHISLLDDPQLVNEFEAYSSSQTVAGNERFGAPEGGFDDCVMATALAWTQVPRTTRVRLDMPKPEDIARLQPRVRSTKSPFGWQPGFRMPR